MDSSPPGSGACSPSLICPHSGRMLNSAVMAKPPGAPSTHEDLSRHHGPQSEGSNRGFGLVFAGVFTIVGLFPLIGGRDPRWWALAIAGAFAAAAFLWPALLTPLNRLWFRFGLLLNRIVNPILMGAIFFTTVTPIALLMRLSKKDPLRLKFDRAARSYWIERRPPGPEPQSMRQQF